MSEKKQIIDHRYDERRDLEIPFGKEKKIKYSSGAKYNIVAQITKWEQLIALGLLIALGMVASFNQARMVIEVARILWGG